MRAEARRPISNRTLRHVIGRVRSSVTDGQAPVSAFVAQTLNDPYRVLFGCILSLRTQDRVTADAAARLFRLAPDVETLATTRLGAIKRAIYPVGFYRRKASQILEIARILVRDFDSRVPDEIDTLLDLPGVGRKTANLVVTVAYGRPGICVDVHVHRISNRWGYVETDSPEETERALRAKLPRSYWIELNGLLVAFGQTVCRPLGPHCVQCPVTRWCPRVGVDDPPVRQRGHRRVTVR